MTDQMAEPAAASSLVVVSGPGKGAVIALPAEELVLGRNSPQADALAGDPLLSRQHARISSSPGGRVYVEDLGSSNGTKLNGVAVAGRQPVRAGDVIEVGGSKLRLVEPPRPTTGPSRHRPGQAATTRWPGNGRERGTTRSVPRSPRRHCLRPPIPAWPGLTGRHRLHPLRLRPAALRPEAGTQPRQCHCAERLRSPGGCAGSSGVRKSTGMARSGSGTSGSNVTTPTATASARSMSNCAAGRSTDPGHRCRCRLSHRTWRRAGLRRPAREPPRRRRRRCPSASPASAAEVRGRAAG